MNDAPVPTSTTATLSQINEDATTNAGQLVSSFLASTDVDTGALAGVAITSLNAGNGTWQYSLDGGTTWVDVGPISESSSLLLKSTDAVRFLPNGIDGTTASFSYRAWDQSSGTAGTKVSTLSNGNETAYSSAVAIATIDVTAVNDAPLAGNDSATSSDGGAVLINVLANDTDPDGGSLSIASFTTGTHGTVSLQSNQILYIPNDGFEGTDAFTYTISDGQGGTAVGNVSVTVGSSSPSPTSTVSVSFRQDTNGYTGTTDTGIYQGKPALTFGDAFVLAPQASSGYKMQALLGFNDLFGTGPGQIPVGATIVSATVTLHLTNTSADGGTIYPMLASWTESSTWNSLGSGVQMGTEATTANAVSVGSVALGARTFDVTGSVAAWATAGSTSAAQNAANKGWLFEPSSTDAWDFMSSESLLKPTLVVTYIPAGSPAPTTTLPTVSISAPTTQLENAGKMTFTLTLSQASTEAITVNFATADGTAKAGADYVASTGSVTFAAGQTSKQIDVVLANDSVAERLESFAVQVTSATNAKVGTATATGRINDDDAGTTSMPALNASVVANRPLSDPTIYKDGSGKYGISDPSGIAYIPGLNQFFIVDSEHDESPFYSAINMFALRPDGSYVRNYSLTSFTKEPTGVAYNPNNGYLYFADDDRQGISWATVENPSVSLGFIDTRRLGFIDTEDLKIDPLTGNIHVLDGARKQIIELKADGTFVDSIRLPSIMPDAEALAYDPQHDLFFVGSAYSRNIWVIDREGNIEATISVLAGVSGLKLKGFELAPSSNPNDGSTLSLYAVDYGQDQVNDGRLWEISLGSDWFM
jgi:hypothetical protein